MAHFYHLAANSIATSPSEWAEYGLTPFTIIDSPQHALADEFANALQLNFEYLSVNQNADGSWSPSWSWGGTFPKQWPVAERDIKSLVTGEIGDVTANQPIGNQRLKQQSPSLSLQNL